MYSWEIERLLKIKQNVITCSEYLEIINTSPQITNVKYNSFNDTTTIKTSDNYDFKIKIKYKDTKK